MSDPIKDLENFNHEGLTVTPLAPSEVRRLGDRRRHRRNALAAGAGAVAAVAAIALPFTLMAGGDSRSDQPGPAGTPTVTQPTDTPPTVTEPPVTRTTIPEGFALLAGVENDPEGSVPTVSPDAEGLGTLALCGREAWPSGSVDRLAGKDPALDYSYTRELLLFRSDVDAALAMTRLRDRLEACDSETTTDGAIPGEEFTVLHRRHVQDTGASDTVTWTDAFADGGIGTSVFQFVRVGNAVAGTRVASESDKDGVLSQLPMVSGASTELVEQMRVFRSPEGSAGELKPVHLLSVDQVLRVGDWAVASTGPADDGSLTVCNPSALSRLGATATLRRDFSPVGEQSTGNRLMTVVAQFPDAEAAAAAYTTLGEELARCEAIRQAGFEVSHEPAVDVPLSGPGQEARVASASWVDPDDGTHAVHLLMNGTALVGTQVVIVSSLMVVQDYWTQDMEQMIATAAARLDPSTR